MQLSLVGVNHKTTPVAIRGKLAIGSGQLQEALVSLRDYVSQGIILCTCNRVEVYAQTESGDSGVPAITRFLNARANLPEAEFLKYIYAYQGEAAVKHLFRVACGLDSMIIGEFEVLGQVRRALEEAEKSRLVELPLLELFRSAVRVGRRARVETGISENAVSVSSVAVDLARQVVGDIRPCKVVVIGAGEAGSLVARVCREQGVSRMVVVSRLKEKGESLAEVLGGRWVPRESLRQELADSDIVISCSGAPHSILKLGLLSEIMSTRSGHPLVIIDIAVPQDVEPEIGKLSNVFLYDIDELTRVCELNQQGREGEVSKAMEIVDDAVAMFSLRWQQFEVRPVISALVRKAEEIRQAQLELTLKKLPALSDEERSYLEAMTKAIVQKMLHEPIQCLKNDIHNRQAYVRIVSELFHLNGKKPSEETDRHRFSRQQTG